MATQGGTIAAAAGAQIGAPAAAAGQPAPVAIAAQQARAAAGDARRSTLTPVSRKRRTELKQLISKKEASGTLGTSIVRALDAFFASQHGRDYGYLGIDGIARLGKEFLTGEVGMEAGMAQLAFDIVAPPKPSDGGAAGEEVVRDWSRRASGRMVRVITKWAQDWCNRGWGPADVRKPDNDEQVNTAVEEILEAEIDSLDEIERRHGASVAKRVAAAVKAKLSNKIKNLLAPNTPGQQEQEYDEGLPFLNDGDDTNDEPPRGAPADGAANAGLARQVPRAAALPATAAAGGAAVAAALPARGAAADAGRAAGGAGSAAAGLDRAGTVTGAHAPVVAGATVDAGGGSGGKGPRPLHGAPAAAAPGGRKKDTGTAKAPPAPSKRLRPTTQANETAYFSD